MKVCILLCPKERESVSLKNISTAISQAFQAKGIDSDILNVVTDTDKKLTLYDYLLFIAEPVSLFGKGVTPSLRAFLENAGAVSGKRAATVVLGGVRKTAIMSTLMRTVESEGIILKTSEFVKKPGEAKAFALSLNVERNY